MTDGSGYIERHRQRTARAGLSQCIAIGYIISAILFGSGIFRYAFVLQAGRSTALAMATAGALGMVVTLILPTAWARPERFLRKFLNGFGHCVFCALLTILYLAFIWPVGLAMRMLRGNQEFHRWKTSPPSCATGWHDKRAETIQSGPHAESEPRSMLIQPLLVLAFFAKRGNYLVIPALILLLALGLILFFVQTSPLAPMIYTLF